MIKLIALILIPIFGIFGVDIINYHQDDYIGKTERIDTFTTNEEYVQVLRSRSYKYNRTDVAYNLTFEVKQDLGTKITVRVQVFKFVSNEYRRFPVNFPVSMCHIIEDDIFSARDLLACGNFTDCPINKGIYDVCKLTLDYSKFPPHLPFGRYLIDLNMVYNSISIMNLKLYVQIKDPKWDT